MEKSHKTEGLLKISELAHAAGVNVTTVKYYVKEGLIEIACKTGPNMAYYHPDSVERVNLIRTLQSEKFYPLSVIKRILKNGQIDFREVELLDAIHKTGRGNLLELVPAAEALKQSGLTRQEAEQLEQAGIINAQRQGRREYYNVSDCRIMSLVHRRTVAGIPFERTVFSLCAYQNSLRLAVDEDIEGLVIGGFLNKPHDTSEIVRMIRTSDETLDEFVTLKRIELNRQLGSERLGRMERFLNRLYAYLAALAVTFQDAGYEQESAVCKTALTAKKTGDDAADAYLSAITARNKGLAISLTACLRGNEYFTETSNDKTRLHAALRLGWLSLSPEEFGVKSIPTLQDDFVRTIKDETFAAQILSLVNRQLEQEP